MKPDITIDPDCASVWGQKITKPKMVSVSEWLEFWRQVEVPPDEAYDEGHADGYDEGYKDGYEAGLSDDSLEPRE